VRIERIREDVNVDAFVRARKFRRRNQRDAFRIRVRLDLEVRREIVVIADREDLDPVRKRDVDDLRRRTRAVGVIGVRVEVGVTQVRSVCHPAAAARFQST
jgi:hypothetical protein